jgi:hypothetical protein
MTSFHFSATFSRYVRLLGDDDDYIPETPTSDGCVRSTVVRGVFWGRRVPVLSGSLLYMCRAH